MKKVILFFLVVVILSNISFATEYYDKVDEHFTISSSYLWRPVHNQNITSLKIDGEIYGPGDVRINLIKGGKKYLLFKRSISNDEISLDKYVEIKEGTNIGLILNYGNGHWDRNDDGIVNNNEGIDFELEPLFFSKYDPTKLCTLWEVYSMENHEITSQCYGSNTCCNFVGHSSIVDKWDEDFVLIKGQQGSTSKNIVIARIIFYDGQNVDYSNQDGLGAFFVDPEVEKMMNLSYDDLFKSNNYFLEIQLENNTIFHFKGINYNINDGILKSKLDTSSNKITETDPSSNQKINSTPKEIPELVMAPRKSRTKPEDNLQRYDKAMPEVVSGDKNDSFYFFSSGYSNITQIFVNNDNLLVDRVVLPEGNTYYNLWLKISIDNHTGINHSLDFSSNYYGLAVIDLKIPLKYLKNNDLFVYNTLKNLDYLVIKNDSLYEYVRVKTKLSDIDVYLKEKPHKNLYDKLFEMPDINPLIYFFFAILISALILFFYNLPERVYQKNKALNKARYELKVGKRLLSYEELKIKKAFKRNNSSNIIRSLLIKKKIHNKLKKESLSKKRVKIRKHMNLKGKIGKTKSIKKK